MTGGDMVRNLVMAAVANEDLETQEQFYFQYWLKPSEERITLTTSISVTEFLYDFVQKYDFNHESKTEIFTKLYLEDKPEETKNMLAYARFYSLYEWRLQMEVNESVDSMINDVDQDLIIKVTKEILTEMAKDLFLKNQSN